MANRKIRYKSVKMGAILLVIGVVLLVALTLGTVHIGQAEGPFPPDKARRIALQQDEIATARAHQSQDFTNSATASRTYQTRNTNLEIYPASRW